MMLPVVAVASQLLLLIGALAAAPAPSEPPPPLSRRQILPFAKGDFLPYRTSDVAAPVVDLDYAKYAGYYNSTFDLNIYRG